MALVQILNAGRARDPILVSAARNLWPINLIITHIPGKNNTLADLLSRLSNIRDPVKSFHI